MTKEEYAKYLSSDYWKGFSYSIIKERNFTCEDCGKQFPNERNKLQVHHLVYRDVAPWSYKPEEMVVLCERCHKIRHGIPVEPIPTNGTEPTVVGNYVIDNTIADGWAKINEPIPEPPSEIDRWAPEPEPARTNLMKWGLIAAILILPLIASVFFSHQSKDEIIADEEIEILDDNVDGDKPRTNRTTPLRKKQNVEDAAEEVSGMTPTIVDETPDMGESVVENLDEDQTTMTHQEMEKSTSELLDEKLHQNAVRQARRAGVSTEGSTSEILDRITHANVVKQAQRAGVSTEGTTSEILDRITHANVVKQAQRAGVSTEGTTSEILDRITHANVVKQAQRAGVSTEGTTSEILDRITRKRLEKYQ